MPQAAAKYLSDVLTDVYVCSNLMEPALGIHASFLKFPPSLLRTGVEELLEGSQQYRSSRLSYVSDPVIPLERSIIRTFGYWDALILKYEDELTQVRDDPVPQYAIGVKSYCGYVLATNCAVRKDWFRAEPNTACVVDGPPLHGLDCSRGMESGEYRPGLCTHFKINPILLYAGGADLLLHAAQFMAIAMVVDRGFWDDSEVVRLFSTIEGKRTRRGGLLGALKKLADISQDVRFLIYQNLDWNDFSVYLEGADPVALYDINMFFREMPLACANLVARLKKKISDSSSGECQLVSKVLGRPYPAKAGRVEVDVLNGILDVCLEGRPRNVPDLWTQIPVFWDHVDVLSLLGEESVRSRTARVRFATTTNAIPGLLRETLSRNKEVSESQGSLASLDEVLAGAKGDVKQGAIGGEASAESASSIGHAGQGLLSSEYLSGPKDLFLELGRSPYGGDRGHSAVSNSAVAGRWTYAFIEADEKLIYRSPHEKYLRRLYLNLGRLMESRFGARHLEALEQLIAELKLPRRLSHSVISLVRSHLAYNNDALMLNTLYDYHHLWKNLLLCLCDIAAGKADADEWLERRRGLIKMMAKFTDRIGSAINTRYHGSTKMFEVTDLNPNHQGGVDSFLDAYASLIHGSLDLMRYVVSAPLRGVVNISSVPHPRVEDLFGYYVELDWMKLSNPESIFSVLHEVGHQVYKDNVAFLLRAYLRDGAFMEPVDRMDRCAAAEGMYVPSLRSQIKTLLEHIFADLFMLNVVTIALVDGEPQGDLGPLVKDRLKNFYTEWFWFEFQSAYTQKGGLPEEGEIFLALIKWQIISRIVFHLKDDGRILPRKAVDELRTSLSSWYQFKSDLAEGRERQISSGQISAEELGSSSENECAAPGEPELKYFNEFCSSFEFFASGVSSSEKSIVSRLAPMLAEKLRDSSFCSRYELTVERFLVEDTDDSSPTARFLAATLLHFEATMGDLDDGRDDRERDSAVLLSIREAVAYFELLMKHSVNGVRNAGQVAWAKTDSDGKIDFMNHEYTDVILNDRGTAFSRVGTLRARLFSERLSIFNRLADARLRRIGRQFI